MPLVHVEKGSFLAINREERFFCTLLTHALLSSQQLRAGFFGLVENATHIALDPDHGATEIYSEVAWLRDHWRNLGDPHAWSPELKAERAAFVGRCLEALGLDLSAVEDHSFFQTLGKQPKVAFPGRWVTAELGGDKVLRNLKWAFNAKPDFLFVCGDRAVMLEAKVESGPGTSAAGYSQGDVQQVLCQLLPAAAPYLDPEQIQRAWLAPADVHDSHAKTIHWSQLAALVDQLPPGEVDPFTVQGLHRFAQRAQSEAPVPG